MMSETNINKLQERYMGALNQLKALKDELAAQGAIQKDEQFTPLITRALRFLLASRNRQALHVLIELANHADETGLCYPGVQTLGDACGYMPTTVERAIDELWAMDFIRVFDETSAVTGKTRRYYRISPAALHIRSEIRHEAWERFSKFKRAVVMSGETNHIQPDTEPDTQPEKSNQKQEPASSSPERRKTPRRVNGATAGQLSRSEPDTAPQANATRNPQQSDQRASANSAIAQPAQSAEEAPPSSGRPPRPKLYDGAAAHAYGQQPLPDAEAEADAQRLYAMFGDLKLGVARLLVDRYGSDMTFAAAQAAKNQPHAKNPVGIMIADLGRQLAALEDAEKFTGEPTPRKSYADGPDAAYFDN